MRVMKCYGVYWCRLVEVDVIVECQWRHKSWDADVCGLLEVLGGK